MKNYFFARTSPLLQGRFAGLLLLMMMSVVFTANEAFAQLGNGINHEEAYMDLDNDDTFAGGPLRLGVLRTVSSKNWSGISQIDANLSGVGAGLYGGLLIDSDNQTTREWDIWMQGKEVLMDANYMRFHNSGEGLVWGNSSWSNINSRIMDNGDLRLQTDNHFYIQDIDNTGSSPITRFYINTATGKVGIGDTIPSATLNSVGQVRASYEADETNYIEMWHGSSNAYLNFAGAGNLNFRYDNTTYMTMTPTGKFGIGTTNPGEFLEVQPDQDISAIIGRAHIGYNGADTDWASFAHTDMNSDTNYALMQSSTGATMINSGNNRNLEFANNGISRMRLYNVGSSTTLAVETGTENGGDSDITIRGARNATTNGNNASVSFENYDSDAGIATKKLGMISGSVIDPTNNIGDLVFYTYADGATASEALRLTSNGEAATKTLYVETQAVIKQLEIDPDKTTWPDYVFKSDYNLRSLSEVEGFVEKNGHLPEVPSASEVAENGINVYEMQELMMKKIEELTLYMIDLKKENTALKSRIDQLSK